MKIKILFAAAALLIFSGCKKNIDEIEFTDSSASLTSSEIVLTTYNTKTETNPKTTAVSDAETTETDSETTGTTIAEPVETTAGTTTAEVKSDTASTVTTEASAAKTTPTETLYTQYTQSKQDYELNSSADICFSKLSFGMSAIEASEIIKTEPETSAGACDFYSNVSFDLDESFCEGYIVYDFGISQVVMNTTFISEKKAAELRDSVIGKLNGIYGLSNRDWTVGYNGIDNVCIVGGRITLQLSLNQSGDKVLVALTITSPAHMINDNAEKIPIYSPN